MKKSRKLRKDAIKRSKAVIGGQVAEQIAPLLPDFPSPLADARFIGKPVDFIAFPGLEESDKVKEILLSNKLLSKERIDKIIEQIELRIKIVNELKQRREKDNDSEIN